MKRLIETVKDWLRYDDIMAERGSDGGENDSNWDNAKVAMSQLVQEPLKVYETVIVRDIENQGVSAETKVFADISDACNYLLKEIEATAKLLGEKPFSEIEMKYYKGQLLDCLVVDVEHEDSIVTFTINEEVIRNGTTDSDGECR